MSNLTARSAISALLAGSKATYTPAGKYASAGVEVSKGAATYGFTLGTDGKWRAAYVVTRSTRFISGEGCDASGYLVVELDALVKLNALAN